MNGSVRVDRDSGYTDGPIIFALVLEYACAMGVDDVSVRVVPRHAGSDGGRRRDGVIDVRMQIFLGDMQTILFRVVVYTFGCVRVWR